MREYYLRIIEFDGTNDLYLKQAETTLGVVTDTEIDNIIESLPTTISQQLDIKDSKSTISAITIKTLNKDEQISDLLFDDFYGANNFYDKKCELGYYDTVLTSKVVMYTGIFDKISNDVYESWYGFTLKDGLEKLKNTSLAYTSTGAETFKKDTLLAEEMPNTTDFTRFGRKSNDGYTSSYLDNYEDTTVQATYNDWTTTKWIVLSWSGHPIDLAKYLMTELEVEYDGDFGSNQTSGTLTVGKIYKILTYVAGDDFDNVANVIEGTITTSGCIFLSTGTTPTTWTNSSTLQLGGSFEEVQYDTKNSLIGSFYYEWKKPIKNTLDWITEQIFKPLNAYPIIKADGKIYLRTLKQPSVVELPKILSETNIKKINSNTITKKDIINHIFIDSDYNIEEKEYLTQVYEIANTDSFGNDSVSAFGYSPKSADSFEIEGLNSNSVINSSSSLIDRIFFSQELASYIFSRFALTTRVIKLEAAEDIAKDIDIGDVVVISGTKIIQWKGTDKGVRGLPILDSAAYGKVGNSFWGNYVDVWESNDFLDDATTPRAIQVSELIIIDFFEDLLENYNLDDAFLTQHNR